MRRVFFAGLLAVASVLPIGCVLPIYSASPDRRARQMIDVSENLRHIPNIWERTWFLDVPDFCTPYRTHGGVI
jgi:hypothetical protein